MNSNRNHFDCNIYKNQLSYNPSEDYSFKCPTCERDYQVSNGKLIVRADLYIGDPNRFRYPENNIISNKSYNWILPVLIGGLLVFGAGFKAVLFLNSKLPDEANAEKAIAPIITYSSPKDSMLISNAQENQKGNATSPLATTDNGNIIKDVSLTTDSSFNSQLSFIVNNPYDKPFSNIQVAIYSVTVLKGQIHNEKAIENVSVGNLRPNDNDTLTIPISDKINSENGVNIKPITIRFSDGSSLKF